MASPRKKPKLSSGEREEEEREEEEREEEEREGEEAEGEDSSSDEGCYGLTRPSVIEQLKSILDQYPDDGQILKELIQNAEDAGASTVKLVYDGRSYTPPGGRERSRRSRSRSDKQQPHLLPLQSPALCAYNDALFTDEDWEGITMLHKSFKAKNVLKVGRFGLGFKSVFHVTDYICIISGEQILFINPHQSQERMCWRGKLAELKPAVRRACLQTMGGLFRFQEDVFPQGFPGTLFWLPLRRQASQLSDTPYTQERVDRLFQCLRAEAPTLLLFLRQVESVELYRRGAGQEGRPGPTGQGDAGQQPAKVFSASLAQADLQEVRHQRSSFTKAVSALKSALPPRPLTSFCRLGVELWSPDLEGRSDVSLHRWLVGTRYSGSDVTEELKRLCGDPGLSYSPLVGLAAPLSGNESDFQGQISCFLPLPLQSKSPTGLPVHVNGFFALSQNRRHLKWPSADQAAQPLSDRALLWNRELVRQVLPPLYADMVNELTSESDVTAVDRALPRDPDVQEEWQALLPELYRRLQNVAWARSPLQGGRWVRPDEAVLAEQGLDRDVLDVYLQLGCHVVQAADHVARALRRSGCQAEASPGHLAPMLQARGIPEGCGPAALLQLLLFLLSPPPHVASPAPHVASPAPLLAGLPLLPTADGDFRQFRSQQAGPSGVVSPVYMSSPDVSSDLQGLLPSLGGRLLLQEGVSPQLRDRLHALAQQGEFQLRCFRDSDLAPLLKEAIAADASLPTSLKWLEMVWKEINRRFKTDLTQFEELPIVPRSHGGGVVEHAYRLTDVLICRATAGMEPLDASLCSALRLLGVAVLERLEDCVSRHSCVLGRYVQHPVGVVSCLARLQGDRAQAFNSAAGAAEKQALVDCLYKHSDLSRAESLLQRLQLFTSTDGRPVSLQEAWELAPREGLPVPWPAVYVEADSEEQRALARTLGASEVSLEDAICKALETLGRRDQDLYTDEERERLMAFVMESHLTTKRIVDAAGRVPFLKPSPDSPWVKACDLFDPEEKAVAGMFRGEEKFPPSSYARHLPALRRLGLKQAADVRSGDVLSAAKAVERLHSTEKEGGAQPGGALQKATKLVEFLTLPENQEKLPTFDLSSLRGVACWPCLTSRPPDYPRRMPFHAADLSRPQEACTRDGRNAQLVGSTMAVSAQAVEAKLAALVGLQSQPPPESVLQQARELISSYSVEEYVPFLSMMTRVYDYFAKLRLSEDILDELREMKFIWTGEETGFYKPEATWLRSSDSDLRLAPYKMNIPSSIREFEDLFCRVGAKLEQTHEMLEAVLREVRSEHEEKPLQREAERDRKLVIDILNRLAGDEDIRARCVPVPVHTGPGGPLLLRPAPDCTYCDSDWLRDDDQQPSPCAEDGDEIMYVHPDVLKRTAIKLGVASLKSRFMCDTEDMDTNFEQTEPLTLRLHGLLKDYPDGLAVPKELVQNADDAGASVVRFLYDQRENQDARRYLVDPAMAECQGPALWAFNDARFSEEDFRNITRLNGATKEACTTKIGRFGLGFNAVYNLTDIPSFASGSTFAIFDPHRKFLGEERPGLKVDLKKEKNRRMLQKMKDQFKPFHGVFGCNVEAGDGHEVISGTLFRLPLRTASQADSSEIKQSAYTDKEVQQLATMFFANAGSILLFTQSVTKVEMYSLPKDAIDASNPTLWGSCSKNEILPSTVERPMMLFDKHWKDTNPPDITQILQISLSWEERESRTRRESCLHWLVCWAQGCGEARDQCREGRVKGLLPVAATAVPVRVSPDLTRVEDVIPLESCPSGFLTAGHVYCFLPLPIPSSLPLHVNAAFAVKSDRRELKRGSSDDKVCPEGEWNKALTRDAARRAYILLLQSLRLNGVEDERRYYGVWPTQASAALPELQREFCTAVEREDCQVFVHQGRWTSLRDAILLDSCVEGEAGEAGVRHLMLNIMKEFLQREGRTVIDPPPQIVELFENPDFGLQDLRSHTLLLTQFFKDVFLPHIKELGEDERDLILRYGLHREEVRRLMKDFPCIPSSPRGTLKKPSDLIHPSGLASRMFTEADERFPAESMREDDILQRLHDLGMPKDEVNSGALLDRVRSVQQLVGENPPLAVERSREIIQYMMRPVQQSCGNLGERFEFHEEVKEELSSLPFLPVHKKPLHWPGSWKSEDPDVRLLASAKELFFWSCADLIGTRQLLLDEASLHMRGAGEAMAVLRWLGVRGKEDICAEEVTEQLLQVALKGGLLPEERGSQHSCCEALYQHLEYVCKSLSPEQAAGLLRGKLQGQPVLLHDGAFATPQSLVFQLEYDCPPYLMRTSSRNLNFLQAAGVKSKCDVAQVVSALRTIREQTGGGRLSARDITCVTKLAGILSRLVEEGREKPNPEEIHLPGRDGLLHPVSQLCLDDCPWVQQTDSMRFLHDEISPKCAKALGVMSKRDQDVGSMLKMIPWGQNEALTTRLRRILSSCPRDGSILKEILQNADDAGATQVKLILDARSHGTERLMAESFAPLQGPALCLYNDSNFTERDIQGIQNLGQGSKEEDLAKTGQFGVGFNAVYHLTDAPSFLTVGPGMPRRLCVLDPLCRYVPGAQPSSPGGMFCDIDSRKASYPDQFQCYLEEQLDLSTRGTVFRLPLRTEAMAEHSAISNAAVSETDVKELLEKFKIEAFDSLIFLRSVCRVGIYYVSQEGELEKQYEVTVDKSSADQKRQESFSKHLDRAAENVKERGVGLSSIVPCEITLRQELQDDCGRRERWLVVHRLGFSGEDEIPSSVEEAWTRKELKLLPRGAVAVPLSDMRTRGTRFKAFCSLPLPIETGLPVHVNGMFFLDNESRRNLWKGTNDFRTDWNTHLTRRLIVPAYLSALASTREDWFSSSTYPDVQAVTRQLSQYHRLFPDVSQGSEELWKNLRKWLYQRIVEEECQFFPVLRHDQKSKEKYELQFASATSSTGFPGYFNRLREYRDLSDEAPAIATALKKLGMNVLESPLGIFHALREVCPDVKTVTPMEAADFLRSFRSDKSGRCRLDQLPRPVEDTPLGTVEDAHLLLRFCGRPEESVSFSRSFLSDLPLEVRADGHLDVFGRSPLFVSEYLDLLPESRSRFLHAMLVPLLKNSVNDAGANLKRLDLTSFDSLLKDTLSPAEWQRDVKAWDRSLQGPGGGVWVARLWEYIHGETTQGTIIMGMDTVRQEYQRALSPLGCWDLLPALTPRGEPVLYRLDSDWQVYTPTQPPSPLSGVLAKVPLPQLDVEVLGEDRRVAEIIVSSLDNPAGLLKCLSSSSDFTELRPGEARRLLSFFWDNVSRLKAELGHPERPLRNLQLYSTLGGMLTRISNTGKTICVQEPRVPDRGITEWSRANDLTMLRSTCIPEPLLEYLEVLVIDATTFYAKYLIPGFQDLPRQSRQEHLEYIRDKLLSQEKIIDALKHLAFVEGSDGVLRSASEFYSWKVDVFQLLRPDKLPPHPFCTSTWHRFMKSAGMVTKLTADMVVHFADQLVNEGTNQLTADLREKSRVLVRHILSDRDLHSAGLLPRIKDKPFIPPFDLNDDGDPEWRQLVRLAEQHPEASGLVSFSQALSPRHQQLVWTSCPMVHPDCDPESILTWPSLPQVEGVMKQLDMPREPPPLKVADHLQRVCARLQKKSPQEMRELRATITKVMRSNYEFLQNHLSDIGEALHGAPAIYLPLEDKVVLPSQVLLDIREEEIIPGYLSKCASDFGSYFPLFRHFGVSERATAGHYAVCLEKIAESVGRSELHQQDWQNVAKAVSCLFRCLESHQEKDREMRIQTLFLPDCKERFRKSTELLVSNKQLYQSRWQELDLPMFLGFEELKIQGKDTKAAFNLLPQEHRPRPLWQVVKEVVCQQSVRSASEGEMSRRFTDFLSSQNFLWGAVRLGKQGRQREADLEQQIKTDLSHMTIAQVESLQTILLYEGKEVQNSARERSCFYQKEKGEEGDAMNITLYISSKVRVKGTIASKLTAALLNFPGFKEARRDLLLRMLSVEDSSEIAYLLDEEDVPPYGSGQQETSTVFQPPGTPIPVRFHCYLDNSFAVFHPGEYVGYCVYDPMVDDPSDEDPASAPGGETGEQSEEEGEDRDCPFFIYARVRRRLPPEGPESESWPQLTARYEVDVGGEEEEKPVEVTAAQLYKFSREKRSSSRDLVIRPGPSAGSAAPAAAAPEKDLDAVLKEIRELLARAYRLPGKEGRRCLLRLLLKWHPDKNHGNEAFCTKVTQAIQNYWQRLSRGEDLSEEEEEEGAGRGARSSTPSSGAWTHFFRRTRRRGRFHRRHWNQHGYSSSSASSGSSSESHPRASGSDTCWHTTVGRQPNPQPAQASRWLRQARVDRDTARGLLPLCRQDHAHFQRSFNWVCLLCHHAAEKALKAVLYWKDAGQRGLRSHVLSRVSWSLESEELQTLARSLEKEIGSFNEMRYPDVLNYPKIPSDVYSRETAEKAYELMSEVLTVVERTLRL